MVVRKKYDAQKAEVYQSYLQSSAWGNAFLITYSCTEQIRKEGSEVSVNKLNSDHGVYDISCATK